MDKIILKDMEILAKVGVTDEERSKKQELSFEVEVETDTKKAAEADSLEHTINYKDIYNKVMEVVSKEHNLIETIAEETAEAIHKDLGTKKVKIRIFKKKVYGSPGIEIEREF